MRQSIVLIPLAFSLFGCLDGSAGAGGVPPQCYSDSDCSGEQTCQNEVCQGGDTAPLRAVLTPLETTRLPEIEVLSVEILDGVFQNLRFPRIVRLDGEVTVQGQSISARVTVRRDQLSSESLPPFVQQDSTENSGFSFFLPARESDDSPRYSVTIIPLEMQSIAPPLALTVSSTQHATGLQWELVTGRSLKTVSGRIVDTQGIGVGNLRVSLHHSEQSEDSLLSSIGLTDVSGNFSIVVPQNTTDSATLRVTPQVGDLIPALTYSPVDLTQTSDVTLAEISFPEFASATSLSLEVVGVETSGLTNPSVGSIVQLETVIPTSVAELTARYEVSGTTDSDGLLSLPVIRGANNAALEYRATILPPPSSSQALFAEEISITSNASDLDRLVLDRRTSVIGRVHEGTTVGSGLTVTAHIDFGKIKTYPPEVIALAQRLQTKTATTDENGNFNLLLDPTIAGLPLHYTFNFRPTTSWARTFVDVEIAGEPIIDLGDIFLSEATTIVGYVLDSKNAPLSGVRVQIFEDCQECPALTVGDNVSQDNGIVEISLPKR